jgi:hypothetical protein
MVELRINYKFDFMYFPADHITAITDSGESVQAMADELGAMGCPDGAMKVLHGESGAELLGTSGLVVKLLRSVAEKGELEISNLDTLQYALRRGCYVFTVRVENDAQRDAVIDVMRRHDAYFIHAYTLAGIVYYDA